MSLKSISSNTESSLLAVDWLFPPQSRSFKLELQIVKAYLDITGEMRLKVTDILRGG